MRYPVGTEILTGGKSRGTITEAQAEYRAITCTKQKLVVVLTVAQIDEMYDSGSCDTISPRSVDSLGPR